MNEFRRIIGNEMIQGNDRDELNSRLNEQSMKLPATK